MGRHCAWRAGRERVRSASAPGRVDALNRDRLFFFYLEAVHADDDGLFVIDSLLIFVRGVLNFVLHEAALDSFEHSAEDFDLA